MNEPAPPERQQPLWRRLAARAALVGGLLIAAALLLPAVPREQVLVFRLNDPGSVRRLEVAFTREGEAQAESGVSLRYASAAPATVRHAVSLPNGRYRLAISVERELPEGRRETSLERRVTLEGGETVVALEVPP